MLEVVGCANGQKVLPPAPTRPDFCVFQKRINGRKTKLEFIKMKKIESDSENSNRVALRQCQRLLSDFNETAAGRRAEGLLAKHSFKTDFLFTGVHFKVNEALQSMVADRLYTSEQFCGEEMWSQLYPAEKRVVGMCVAYLVSTGAVGLTLHRTPSGKGKKRYRLLLTQALVEMPVSRAVRGHGHGSALQMAC